MKKNMDTKTRKIMRKFFCFILILNSFISVPAFAKEQESAISQHSSSSAEKRSSQLVKDEPIHVDADNQKIDFNKDDLLFTGNVIAIQGTLKVESETLLVDKMSNQEEQVMTAKGNPVYFEQQIEGKEGPELVKGNGSQLVYNVAKGLLTLSGNAIVYKQDGTVKGNVITYDLNNDVIKAFSGSGQRVNTVLQPTKKD